MADLASLEVPGNWARKYIVPAKAKGQLRDLLLCLGISQMTLFPDLAALCEELKTRNFA
jgi:hypothetical protein